MGFSSFNDFLSEANSAGKIRTFPFLRTIQTGANSAAGRIHECFTSAGTGGAHAYGGAAGAARAASSSDLGALPINAAVTPDTRHLVALGLTTAATTAVPGVAFLIDIIGYHPSCVVSTGAGTTITTITLLSRSNANADVQVAAFVQTALGAATPTLTVTYTNSAGTSGRTGTIVAPVASAPIGTVLGGGTAGQLCAPVMTLQAGDTGVQSIQSYTTASGTTGTIAFVFFRYITPTPIPLVAANTSTERDYMFQLPSMPRIYDDSCLSLMIQVGGALTTNQVIHGAYTVAWG